MSSSAAEEPSKLKESDPEIHDEGGVAAEAAAAAVDSKDEGAGQQHESTSLEPILVDWDEPTDPQNPINWPSSRKWGTVGILSLMCLLT